MSEIEAERLSSLAEAKIEHPEKFAPGSFGCHEVLHLTSTLEDMVAKHLVDHPAIMLDSDFYRRARDVHSALFDLYQAIGAKHLKD